VQECTTAPGPSTTGACSRRPGRRDTPFSPRWVEGEGLRPEEMEPQVLMGLNCQVPLADGGEDGRLSDGVRVEVVQLHPIVVRQSSHEVARRNSKPRS
jgi:hypothetical protein